MKVTDIKIIKNSFGDTNMDPCKIANILKYKFATLSDFKNLNRYRPAEQINSPPIITTRNRFYFRYVTSKEVLDKLRQLNGNKPLGPSQAWAFRDTAPCIHIPLSFIVINANETQTFSSDLKKTENTPIFKKSKETDLINYEPISITPALAKVFERLMQNQTTDYLERKKIQSACQFGFRKTRSLKDALQ